MQTILLVTVGGSAAPIVNAVTKISFDSLENHIYFICSKGAGRHGTEGMVDGAGTPCYNRIEEKYEPAITVQAAIPTACFSKVVLENPDDLGGCYLTIAKLASTLHERHGANTIIRANYTGGTKTMSVALGLVAAMENWQIQVNIGPRSDLCQVETGDMPTLVYGWHRIAEAQLLDKVRQAAVSYDYSGIVTLVNNFLSLMDAKSYHLPFDTSRYWNDLYNVALGFAAWDIFDHQTALRHLRAQGSQYGVYLGQLTKLTRLDKAQLGYAMVFDLLHNAERRAARNQFDDGVGRLYRATEMVGQIELAKALRQTSDTLTAPLSHLALDDLPPELQAAYESHTQEDKRTLLLGLRRTYQLLADLKAVPGLLFKERESQLLNSLTTRNHSILAHGIQPVDAALYQKVSSTLVDFIQTICQRCKVKMTVRQLPCEFNPPE